MLCANIANINPQSNIICEDIKGKNILVNVRFTLIIHSNVVKFLESSLGKLPGPQIKTQDGNTQGNQSSPQNKKYRVVKLSFITNTKACLSIFQPHQRHLRKYVAWFYTALPFYWENPWAMKNHQ